MDERLGNLQIYPIIIVKYGIGKIDSTDTIVLLKSFHLIGNVIRQSVSYRVAFNGRIRTVSTFMGASSLCLHTDHAAFSHVETDEAPVPEGSTGHGITGAVRCPVFGNCRHGPSFV